MSGQGTPGNPQVDALRARLLTAGAGGAVIPTGTAGYPLTGNGPGVAPTYQAAQLTPFVGTTVYVDPSNVTGFASDSNTGLTANNVPAGSGPLLTTAHLNSLMALRYLTEATNINYLSDDNSGTPFTTTSLNFNRFTLNVIGTPQKAVTTTVVAATAVTPLTNTRQTVQFAISPLPYILTQLGGSSGAQGYFFIDRTGGNSGVSAWIVASAGGNTAYCSIPLDSTFSTISTVSPGDTVDICRGSFLNCGYNVYQDQGDEVLFQNVSDNTSSGSSGFFQRSSVVLSSEFGSLHGFIVGINTTTGISEFQFGVYVSTFDTTHKQYDTSPSLQILSSTYVTGYGILVGPGGFGELVVTDADSGKGICLSGCTSPLAALLINGDVSFAGNGVQLYTTLAWGSGNTGVGIALGPGASLTVPANATERPLVTGTAGDFGFIPPNSGAGSVVTTARPWNEGGGTWGAAATTTWANLTNAASLNYNAHDVGTNAVVIAL